MTKALGRFIFEKYFKINSLGLYQPKKDQYNLSIVHENGNFTDEAQEQQVAIQKKIRQKKEYDKEKAKRNGFTNCKNKLTLERNSNLVQN